MKIFPDIDKTKLDDFYKTIGTNVKRVRKEKQLSHPTSSLFSNEHFN